jgi:hypothetical protein
VFFFLSLIDCGRRTLGGGKVVEGFVLWRASVCVFFVRSFWSLSLFLVFGLVLKFVLCLNIITCVVLEVFFCF